MTKTKMLTILCLIGWFLYVVELSQRHYALEEAAHAKQECGKAQELAAKIFLDEVPGSPLDVHSTLKTGHYITKKDDHYAFIQRELRPGYYDEPIAVFYKSGKIPEEFAVANGKADFLP